MYIRHGIKVGLAVLAAAGTGGALWTITRPPQMTPVAVLTKAVAPMRPVPVTAVHWMQVVDPPPQAITRHTVFGSWVAGQRLAPGTVLTTRDFTLPQSQGLHAGEVQWLVPVSAATSGLPTLDQRVDVWSKQNGTYHLVASGVRVIGLFTAGGGPINGASSSSAAPGLVGLAVPSAAIGPLLNVPAPALVVDPNQFGFQLAASTAAASKTVPTPSPTPSSRKTPALPSAKTG